MGTTAIDFPSIFDNLFILLSSQFCIVLLNWAWQLGETSHILGYINNTEYLQHFRNVCRVNYFCYLVSEGFNFIVSVMFLMHLKRLKSNILLFFLTVLSHQSSSPLCPQTTFNQLKDKNIFNPGQKIQFNVATFNYTESSLYPFVS